MRGEFRQKAVSARHRLFLFGLVACALPAIAMAQDVRRFDLALKAGELPKEQRTIKVKQGEAVELSWTSDQPARMHLHGYDVLVTVKPGEPTVTKLDARIAGRFSVDKVSDKSGGHHHGGKVLYLEVHPQ